MYKKFSKRLVALFLAVLMIVMAVPVVAEDGATETTGSVTNYEDFMSKLKQLEIYADEYAKAVAGRDPGELVLNFIRTGVERYQDDNWTTLAGQEIVGFTNYVKDQDARAAANEVDTTNNVDYGTYVDGVMDLRNIVTDEFKLPNGNFVDFGHMFGCMNISYVAKGSADLSGWAGDICDLLQYSRANLDAINENTDGTIESMTAYIQKNCFGVDASGAFGWDDFWGDMDAYYLISEYEKAKKAGDPVKFSTIMEAYFTGDLNDTNRTVYFMNNRFAVADSPEAVRKAIYESYSSDVGISILESKRGLTSYSALREACCYAVADYIYSQAKGQLIEGAPGDDAASNGYYSVFSTESSILAPGITQDIKYAQTVDGKQIVYYVATVDVKRDDVDLLVNYNNNAAPTGSNIGLQTVRDQVAALVKNNKDKENFYPIVATNGAGYNITNGTPAGLVVMQGVEYYPVGAPGFFAILEDGTAVIGDKAKYEELKKEGTIKEAIQAFGSVLVKDGKVCVTKSANYTANRASRTAIGITAEGKVVMMVLDGRQLPRSAGGAMEEIATIMLEAGCVEAVNLDGGGSTTYLSKPAGKDDIELVNVPSDGYERRVATSLVAVSTAAPSTAFDKAILSSDYEYITAGTSMQFRVTGVSNTGNAAEIPEGAYWRVSDETLATIDETGLFTARATGDVSVQFVVNDEVRGEKVIHVVVPDDIKFVEDRITAIYGDAKKMDVTVWYQGKPVAFTPLRDAFVFFDYEFDQYGQPILYFTSDAGVINGLEFVGTDAKKVRTVPVYAALMIGKNIIATAATISLYYENEATFDFANATMGNRSFAWIRNIENAKTLDNQLYRVSDPDSPIVIDYTFGLDMTAIDFPAQLEPMKSMLPTYTENATAWDYLLQLAERVCTQTKVTIRAEFSKDLEVDISGLNVVTEYFTPTSIVLDENNVLTIVCNWVNQSQPIDPATANSLCILTGIKATVKDTAAYYDNKLAITNNGTVSYDIYLAASSLYSFANDPSNQAKYGLIPYIHEEDCRSDFATDDPNAEEDDATATNNDKGAKFSGQYVDFADSYLISTEVLNGWHEEGKDYYYYVNNEPVTGIQLVTDRHDASQDRFYEFDETGKLVNEQGYNGLVEIGENLYYAVLGVAQTGWQQIDGNNYYFHPDTGKAADGEFAIYESANSWQTKWYTYTFENHILVKGAWEYDTDNGQSGWRYRWAGDWKKACWFEVDGETYHVTKNYPYYVTTGYTYVKNYPSEKVEDQLICLFDERGALMKDYVGPVDVEGKQMFIMNGVLYSQGIYPRYNGSTWHKGLAQGTDGYYYFVNNDGSVFLGEQGGSDKWVGVAEDGSDWTNGYTAAGTYTFDEHGRLTDDLLAKSDTTITDATKPAEGTSQILSTEVKGRVLSVTAEITCKVMYKGADGKYHAIEAKVDPYAAAPTDGDTAAEYSFTVPAEATEVKIVVAGDFSGDGQITAEDVTDLQKGALGKEGAALTEEQLLVCDANGDGEITAADMLLIKAAQLGKKQLDW